MYFDPIAENSTTEIYTNMNSRLVILSLTQSFMPDTRKYYYLVAFAASLYIPNLYLAYVINTKVATFG